jgi:hypothetical protein
MLLLASAMLVFFLLGVTIGVIAAVVLAVHREDRRMTLRPDTPRNRAKLALSETLRGPRKTSVISRTPTGVLRVSREDGDAESSVS